jgi:TolA-binding protein
LLQGRGDFSAAIEQWMNVAEGAVHSELAAEAIFRIGFIRESALQDTLGALKAYGELVRVYPESDWSGSAIEAAKWLSFNETEMMKVLDKGRE